MEVHIGPNASGISDAYSFTHVAMEYAEEQRAERLARAEEAKKVKAKKDN